jgi:hypothetical protein
LIFRSFRKKTQTLTHLHFGPSKMSEEEEPISALDEHVPFAGKHDMVSVTVSTLRPHFESPRFTTFIISV